MKEYRCHHGTEIDDPCLPCELESAKEDLHWHRAQANWQENRIKSIVERMTFGKKEYMQLVIDELRYLAYEDGAPDPCASLYYKKVTKFSLCEIMEHNYGVSIQGLGRYYPLRDPKHDHIGIESYNDYPVPHPTLEHEAGFIAHADHKKSRLDMWSGEYGENRREFCAWLADELEELL